MSENDLYVEDNFDSFYYAFTAAVADAANVARSTVRVLSLTNIAPDGTGLGKLHVRAAVDFPQAVLPGEFVALLNSADRRSRAGVQPRPGTTPTSAKSSAGGAGGGVLGTAFSELGPVIVSEIAVSGSDGEGGMLTDVDEILVRRRGILGGRGRLMTRGGGEGGAIFPSSFLLPCSSY